MTCETLIEAVEQGAPEQLAKIEEHIKHCKECQHYFLMIWLHWAFEDEENKKLIKEDQISRLLLKASRITGEGYKRVNNQGRVEEIKWKEKKRKRK